MFFFTITKPCWQVFIDCIIDFSQKFMIIEELSHLTIKVISNLQYSRVLNKLLYNSGGSHQVVSGHTKC